MTNDKLPVEFGEEEARLPATFGTVKVVKDPTGAGKGKSPYIGENGTWMEYDDGIGAYIDTGIAATGPAGKDGKDGAAGKDGADGKNGVDGITPHIESNGNWYIGETDTGVAATGPAGKDGKDGAPGKDGVDGQPGSPGKDGADGKDGVDGYTPVAGKDYFTPTDKQEMVNAVLAALPAAEEASF